MTEKRWLWLIVIVGLALRLTFVLAQDPIAPYQTTSADSRWYLGNAYTLMTGQNPPGMSNEVSNLASPPLYFLVIGLPQVIFSPAGAVIAVRILQAILSTATCYFAYLMARRLTDRAGAGLIAAGVLAVDPAFIIESAQILTETVFIFLIAAGLWLVVEAITESVGAHGRAPLQRPIDDASDWAQRAAPLQRRTMWMLVGAGILFGLASLTRAVFLGVPLVLAVLLLVIWGWRVGWKRAALLLIVYVLVVSTWTIYSVARWNRFVIAGTGLSAFIYLGATGWTGPQQVDQQLAEQQQSGNYLGAAESAISADPGGWIKHRVAELANAYLQPSGTVFYPGVSLKQLVSNWLRTDRSLGGLIELTRGDAFWPKLVLYLFHYTALIGGLVGMWLARRRWRLALPLIGFIGYITLAHLALLATPRYIFPTEVFWWVFAAVALDRLFSKTHRTVEKTS